MVYFFIYLIGVDKRTPMVPINNFHDLILLKWLSTKRHYDVIILIDLTQNNGIFINIIFVLNDIFSNNVIESLIWSYLVLMEFDIEKFSLFILDMKRLNKANSRV